MKKVVIIVQKFRNISKVVPMIAPVAIQQATMAAHNLRRQLQGKSPESFHYKDPGVMVIIGRNNAIAQIRNKSFTGFLPGSYG